MNSPNYFRYRKNRCLQLVKRRFRARRSTLKRMKAICGVPGSDIPTIETRKVSSVLHRTQEMIDEFDAKLSKL
jgi:hypothetical protein